MLHKCLVEQVLGYNRCNTSAIQQAGHNDRTQKIYFTCSMCYKYRHQLLMSLKESRLNRTIFDLKQSLIAWFESSVLFSSTSGFLGVTKTMQHLQKILISITLSWLCRLYVVFWQLQKRQWKCQEYNGAGYTLFGHRSRKLEEISYFVLDKICKDLLIEMHIPVPKLINTLI